MELEQLMARAKARAHFIAARERRLQQTKQQAIKHRDQQRTGSRGSAACGVLRFAAVSCQITKQGQQVQLPTSILDIVMSKIAQCLEPGGVYGPSLVARDLGNASLVCSEFYTSAKYGFTVLNTLIEQQLRQHLHKQPLPPVPSRYLGDKLQRQHHNAVALSAGINLPGPKGWQFWNNVITDPLSVQIQDLEAAAQQMGVVQIRPAAVAVVPGAAADAVANAQQATAAAERTADCAAAAAVVQSGSTTAAAAAARSKHQARLIKKLLACFGLEQPLPRHVAAAAAAAATHHTAASTAAAAAAVPASTASNARAALLRALALERSRPIIAYDGPDQCAALLSAVGELAKLHNKAAARAHAHNSTRGCLANIRYELAAAGITHMQQLQQLLLQEQAAAVAAADRRRQQQQQRDRMKRAAVVVQAPPPKKGKGFSLSSVNIKPKEKDHRFLD